MATKCTMFLEIGTEDVADTPVRLGGFSESWYTLAGFSPSVETAFKTLAMKRAGMLPASGSIRGFRFQETDGLTVGSSTTRIVNIPGVFGNACDVPQMGLKFDIDAAAGPNQRIWIARGIPDGQVVRGEYLPTVQFKAAVLTFFQELGTQWCWRGQVLTSAATPIFTIDNLGVINWLVAPTYTPPVNIKILRARNSAGRGKGGVFNLSTRTGATGQLLGWTHGACTGGKSRLYQITFPAVPTNITVAPVGQAVVKKVGRPLGLYRGRRSARVPG